MTLQTVTSAFKKFMSELWSTGYQTASSSHYRRYVRYGVLVIAAALVTVAAWWGYRWYEGRRDAAAHYSFAQSMDLFTKAQQSKTDMWGEVATSFRMGYEQHPSSSIAPYFLAFQAEALYNEGKNQEAIDVMDRVVSTISSASPLAALYKTKFSLMKLDSLQPEIQQAGLNELTASAHDAKNGYRDQALYYLGLYYAAQGQTDRAKAEWNLLIQSLPTQGQSSSVYAELAQARLNNIG